MKEITCSQQLLYLKLENEGESKQMFVINTKSSTLQQRFFICWGGTNNNIKRNNTTGAEYFKEKSNQNLISQLTKLLKKTKSFLKKGWTSINIF
jgi:hypothetical protein